MPVNRQALPLGASPRSVAAARRWVTTICQELGRDDLADAAELGVSELVTNALLHGAPPISVRVRGTHDHPRIEVVDASPQPPVTCDPLTDQEDLLSTFGRGLGIVAVCSSAWGAALERTGKVVWFTPRADTEAADPPAGEIFDLDRPGGHGSIAEDQRLVVQLIDLPVRTYVDFRGHYRDLRRELHLLALSHESVYPVAKQISAMFAECEEQVPSLIGVEALSQALEMGSDHVDLEIPMPRDAGPAVARMLELLQLADSFCRSQRLLALAATAELAAFQRWYLGEFVRQAQGHPPRPWPDQA